MQGLTKRDLGVLSRWPGMNTINLTDSGIEADPSVTQRLEEAKFITKEGFLTESGVLMVKKVKASLEEKVGQEKMADISVRGVLDPKKVLADSLTWGDNIIWKLGQYKKRTYMTDGRLIFFGNPQNKVVQKEQADGEMRQRFAAFLRKQSNRTNLVQLIAKKWCPVMLVEADFIELHPESEGKIFTIQTRYYDLIKSVFPDGEFYGDPAGEDPYILVIAKRQKAIFKNNMVAVLSPAPEKI